MPLGDAVLFLADARNHLRLVFAHLSYFLPRMDEPMLLRLADRLSPSRPSVAAMLARFALGAGAAVSSPDCSRRPRAASRSSSQLQAAMESQIEVAGRMRVNSHHGRQNPFSIDTSVQQTAEECLEAYISVLLALNYARHKQACISLWACRHVTALQGSLAVSKRSTPWLLDAQLSLQLTREIPPLAESTDDDEPAAVHEQPFPAHDTNGTSHHRVSEFSIALQQQSACKRRHTLRLAPSTRRPS